MRGDEETALFRDRDDSILLMRLPGDAWTVCRCQDDADWIRATECSGALTGLTKDGVSFRRVVPLSEVKEALLGEAEKLEKPPTDIASGSTVHALRMAKAQGIRDAVAAVFDKEGK